MSGPTGAVKSFSVPSFTLKTDMSPMGEVAKPKETEKAAAKTVSDGFEAAKAKGGEEPKAMAKAEGGRQPLPPGLEEGMQFLRNAVQTGRNIANNLPFPLKQIANGLLDKAEKFLNQVEDLIRRGAQIGQDVINGIKDLVGKLRSLPIIGPLLGGGGGGGN